MRIDLPNGAWAELRDPSEVTERLRRPIARSTRGIRPEIVEGARIAMAMDPDPDPMPAGETGPKEAAMLRLQYAMTNEEADAFTDANDYAAVALVESWSFPQEVSLDGLLDLPAHALDALRKAVEPLVERLRLDTSPSPNRAAPSGGSNGSAQPSSEDLPTTSLASTAPTASSSSGSA
jgi:hypothetical protein